MKDADDNETAYYFVKSYSEGHAIDLKCLKLIFYI
jgi:hypothetical protein